MSEDANNPQGELAPVASKPRGRSPGYIMSQTHRDKIRNSNLLTRLLDHGLGNVEMTTTQVTVGLGLIKKYLPDLQGITGGDEDETDPVRQISRIENLIVDPANPGS